MKADDTWILLRGLSREKGHWGTFSEEFRAAHPGRDVLEIDLPGTGEFRDVTSPTGVAGITAFVRAKAIERARANSRFKLLAISLGGMVAMEWMRAKPEELSAVVLMNTSSSTLSPFYNRLRWQVWPQFLKLAVNQVPREREKAIIELLINDEDARARALPAWTKIAVDRLPSYRTVFNQLLAASRFRDLEHKTEVPVLVLSALGDRFVDPSCSTALHEKWGWPIARHPWGGHDLPWDDGPWCIRKIAEAGF